MVPGIILMLALLFVFWREFIRPRIHPLFTTRENLNYAPPLYVHPGQNLIRDNREEKIDLPPDYSRINEYEMIESPKFTPNDLPPPYFES